MLSDLKEVIMHEVGHALGLTHNFRASTIYTRAQLNDLEFTEKNGVGRLGDGIQRRSTSRCARARRRARYSMSTLGPYDYWAVEYGYRDCPAETEGASSRRSPGAATSRCSRTPTTTRRRPASIPTRTPATSGTTRSISRAAASRSSRELWDRWQARPLPVGDSLSLYRRNITRGLTSMREAGMSAARYIGGVSILRDAAGSGRTPLNPVRRHGSATRSS